MEYCTGIDLGSTTTKAVLLAPDGSVLGRGITNSRSNYDTACAVALQEALINARFALIAHELAAQFNSAIPPGIQTAFDAFALAFRAQQYLAQLATLEEVMQEVADRLQYGAAHAQALREICEAMRQEVPALYQPGISRKSDFFRDLAGSRFLHLAQECARQGGPPFDQLAACFDKAILEVENRPDTTHFGSLALFALAGIEEHREVLGPAAAKVAALPLVQAAAVGTGYGRQKLPFPDKQVRSEILCHGLGAHALFPATRTVLDIGGQDTKAIQVDDQGIVTSFQMNDRCAAGCGRYLGYIADEMNLGLHELGPLAEQAHRTIRINSTCTVFAGTELRERLSLGERREDILAGLHRAIILRAMSLLARSGGISEEFTFTGGVAKNPAAVRVLRELVHENYGERTLNISPDSIYTGALGAALFAQRSLDPAAALEVAA